MVTMVVTPVMMGLRISRWGSANQSDDSHKSQQGKT